MNRQWLLKSDRPPYGMEQKPEGYAVDLPYDFGITQKREPDTLSGSLNGFFPGSIAEYQKPLFVPADWKGKKIILEFEGIYMNATVRINSHIVAQHPYGYTSFHCDLTPYLLYGRENVITVHVNSGAMPNTRWYSGSGIYRPVWLMVGESLHIKPWGIYVTTPDISRGSAKVFVRTDIENIGTASASAIVRSTLVDAGGTTVACQETELRIPGDSSAEAAQMLLVVPARLWSVEDPYLYTLKSEVIQEGTVIDSTETRIGIRSIAFSAKEGFKLNGVAMKLKGGCVHHDCGLLGAAAYKRGEERKVELLKASGYNAVRCAHNPPSPSFLDACDRLGMLVIDEAFDCWREGKTPNDYHMYFEDWWDRDLASMVIRDRNHPSIILWSTGNEIVERDGRSEGYAYARKLADYVRLLDNTRAITNGICGTWYFPLFSPVGIDTAGIPEGYGNWNEAIAKLGGMDYWGEVTAQFIEPLDVAGYNYLLDRYESDGEKYPNRIICGTETYPKEVFDYWNAVERLPHVIGDFVWTSLDYLGEAGVGRVKYTAGEEFLGSYPWHHAFCGDIDICGFKRPQSYYRDCVWGISSAPYIAVYKPENHGKNPEISGWSWPDVISSWTWPGYEGNPMVVEVYSTADEVELLINGKITGRKPVGRENRYKAVFELDYEAGELLAVGYQANSGVSRSVLKTAGIPTAIRLTPDRDLLEAKFGDLSYITVELVDSQGNTVHNADNNIVFTACGVGTLLAVGNSNPVSEEMYTGNQRRVYNGGAMAVVRANGQSGKIVLTAESDGIPASSVIICVGTEG